VTAVVTTVALLAAGCTSSHKKAPAPLPTSTGGVPGVASDRAARIPSNGAVLAAEVITPSGSGRKPLLVMPASWGNGATEYHVLGSALAADGFQVVAYGQRGFKDSTGQIDFAGPATQQDASTVIDWALKNTQADPAHIGMMGISYGAGISLLAAAHDSRIKAVVALSTWTNFAESYDANNSPHALALGSLVGTSQFSPHFDTTVQNLNRVLTSNPTGLGAPLQAMSPQRSPQSYVAQLNANRPAIMIGNAFEDSLLPPDQLVPFFSALTTPKKLELAAGDHGGPERNALYGARSAVVQDGVAWLMHYLRGVDNGVQDKAPITLKDVRTGAAYDFDRWPTASRASVLGAPQGTTAAGGQWSAHLTAGSASPATSGIPQIFLGKPYVPPALVMAALKPSGALSWSLPAEKAAVRLTGQPVLHVGLGSTSADASVIAYLYDVTPAGVGSLVDHQAYTALGLSGGEQRAVDITMSPVAWTVPAGDHLAVVIDTVDSRYTSLTPRGAQITVWSSAAHPATLDVPTG
jgi:predicted acyl esterase